MHINELYGKYQQGLTGGELIIDVRDADDYQEIHIPGSRSIPHELILADPQKYATELARFERVYIHCGGGGKAGKAFAALSQAGLRNIVHICDSGMRSWTASGFPVRRS